MAEDNFTLTTFYSSWKEYQDHLKEAIAPLSTEQLALRAAPDLRSVGEIAAHIIGARVGWFNRFLGERAGDENISQLGLWDKSGTPAREATELVQGLDASWALMADALARWSSTDMQKTFKHDWRGDNYELSRSWVLWHILEHDLHHGGELSLTLGAHGLQAPDI